MTGGRPPRDAGEREPGEREPEPQRAAGTHPDSTAPGDAASNEVTYHCDLCGHPMLDLHCKLICERCGYKRDCSDP